MLLSQNLDKLAERGRDDACDLEPIQTHEIRPPVPSRRYDWVAYRDPERRPYGYGPTEAEAIRDLLNEEGMLE